MKNLFEQFKKESLTKEERNKILSVLKVFVAEHPVQRVKSPLSNFWLIARQRSVFAPIVAALFLVMTGGAYAAQNSVPGDPLYQIKITTEKIESRIALGSKTAAKVNTTHAVARLKEVEQMAASGKPINTEVSRQIENSFDTQAEQALSNIQELKKSGDSEAASQLENSFKTAVSEHEKVMTRLLSNKDTSTSTKEQLASVISNIHAKFKKELEATSTPPASSDSDQAGQNSGQTATSTPNQNATTTPDQNATSTPVSNQASSTPVQSTTTPVLIPASLEYQSSFLNLIHKTYSRENSN